MKIYYISPSTIPSRTANSIHVVNMCGAFAELGHNIILFTRSKTHDGKDCRTLIKDYYGVKNKRIGVVVFRSSIDRGVEFFIAICAITRYIKDIIIGELPDLIFSRNLYGAIIFGLLFKRRIVYETHTPERGFRKIIQGWLLKVPWIHCIVISEALRKVIGLHHSVPKKIMHVMHDAAHVGPGLMSNLERQKNRMSLLGAKLDLKLYNKFIGYFGHLYSGRGIAIIREMASTFPDYAFILYGGNEKDLKNNRMNHTSENIYFMGHIGSSKVRKAMAMMDILLMPYQKSVSIGINGVDTAKWMSPLKMFEYMSSGVPIISSNLQVLREVLEDRKNSILVPADNINAWQQALRLLSSNPYLGRIISNNAYRQFYKNHTWYGRAKSILDSLGHKN